MRLQKYLASCGIASRRKCEALILEGKIKINGEVVQTLGTKVTPTDEVYYEGERLILEEKPVYYLLNKPVGYVTTVQDERGRATVLDLMEEVEERIFPVGRLDYNTSGLLIMTNDGELTYGLTHPKHHVNKTYEAKVSGSISKRSIHLLEQGVMIDGKKTYPAEVEIVKTNDKYTWLRLTIHEGRNRQVRKMCEAVGHPVSKLKRLSIGKLELGDLKEGSYRSLTGKELDYLKSLIQEVSIKH